jgi:hypothetical protein
MHNKRIAEINPNTITVSISIEFNDDILEPIRTILSIFQPVISPLENPPSDIPEGMKIAIEKSLEIFRTLQKTLQEFETKTNIEDFYKCLTTLPELTKSTELKKTAELSGISEESLPIFQKVICYLPDLYRVIGNGIASCNASLDYLLDYIVKNHPHRRAILFSIFEYKNIRRLFKLPPKTACNQFFNLVPQLFRTSVCDCPDHYQYNQYIAELKESKNALLRDYELIREAIVDNIYYKAIERIIAKQHSDS